MPDLLSRELQTFDQRRGELLASDGGKFALIHDDELVGTYDTEGDAVAEGYRRLGNVPFLVKQVVAVEVPETFVSNLIGI